MSEYEPLDDMDIVNLIDQNIGVSVGYYDSELSNERKEVVDYYNAHLPKPAHDGNSKYCSMDVYDAVEAMKAALVETFSGGNKIVRFAASSPEDVPLAEIATRYTDYVAFQQNDLFSVLNQVVHDGLTARVGIAKVFWEQKERKTMQYFEDLSEDEVNALLAEDDVELIEEEVDELGLRSGSIEVTSDASQVTIKPVAPEEFLIEPQAKSLEDVNFCAYRTKMTISELLDMGYDPEIINRIGDHEDVDMDTDQEVLARHEDVGQISNVDVDGYQEQVREVMVYEAYIVMDVEGLGKAELYRVLKAGNAVLELEPVNRKPFCIFVPLPIPHAFYGSNFADKVIATQNARTVLTRSILDHAMITNNPRYTVVKGGLTNPRELLDNRVGGIVNVSRPDAINPMPQAPLNPFIFQTIKMLDEDKEDTTGISRLSQGLNKDAVSKQNSAAMVEQLATMSMQRQKIIARNLANQFVKPLFQEIYTLVVENEEEDKIIEVAGNFIQVSPTQWQERRDVIVELKLGYGEQDREAQKYMQLHQMFTQDPGLQPMYTPQNRYALVTDMLEKSGIMNAAEYLTPPDQIQPPQPSAKEQMDMQVTQKTLELQERNTAIAEQKAMLEAQIKQAELQLDALKVQNDQAIKSDSVDLKEEQFKHKQRIDNERLSLDQTK